jgi:hypothetical protein
VAAAAWTLLCLLLLLGPSSRAEAHPAATSTLVLEQGLETVSLELRLPIDQLALALAVAGEVDADAWLAEDEARLRVYVLEHLALLDAEGEAWPLELRALVIERVDDAPQLVARLAAHPPQGAAAGPLRLRCDAIVHRVVSHRISVHRGRNFAQARFDGEGEALGILHYQRKELDIADEGGAWWRGFVAMVGVGADHIAHGTDHLLFVLALLLVAVVQPREGRWREGRSTREGLRAIALVVTAFTLGHSLTLALGVAGLVLVPSRAVEIAIALTLVISALHALRPIFPRREALVAAGFGLVHGLAFAAELADFAPDAAALAVGLAGFNLGIELVQLGLVLAIAPALLILARGPAYRGLRTAGATLIGAAALAWLLVRIGVDPGFEPGFATLDTLAPWLVASVALGLSLVAGLRPRLTRP